MAITYHFSHKTPEIFSDPSRPSCAAVFPFPHHAMRHSVTPSRHVHAGRTVLLQGAERRVHGRDVGRGLTATLAS